MGAQRAAAEAAAHVANYSPDSMWEVVAYQGWAAMLAGDSHTAEEYFLAAQRHSFDHPQHVIGHCCIGGDCSAAARLSV
jgi:hypothetical protein